MNLIINLVGEVEVPKVESAVEESTDDQVTAEAVTPGPEPVGEIEVPEDESDAYAVVFRNRSALTVATMPLEM